LFVPRFIIISRAYGILQIVNIGNFILNIIGGKITIIKIPREVDAITATNLYTIQLQGIIQICSVLTVIEDDGTSRIGDGSQADIIIRSIMDIDLSPRIVIVLDTRINIPR
jgi:hypothetical protein